MDEKTVMYEKTMQTLERAYLSDVQGGYAMFASALATAKTDEAIRTAREQFRRRLESALAVQDAALEVLDEVLGTPG